MEIRYRCKVYPYFRRKVHHSNGSEIISQFLQSRSSLKNLIRKLHNWNWTGWKTNRQCIFRNLTRNFLPEDCLTTKTFFHKTIFLLITIQRMSWYHSKLEDYFRHLQATAFVHYTDNVTLQTVQSPYLVYRARVIKNDTNLLTLVMWWNDLSLSHIVRLLIFCRRISSNCSEHACHEKHWCFFHKRLNSLFASYSQYLD